eukprot:scaffold62845_cov49-Attheya_sp.AAC.4
MGGGVVRGLDGGKGARVPVPRHDPTTAPRRRHGPVEKPKLLPGEGALAEIRILQASVGLIIPKAAVSRLVRELTNELPGHKNAIRWTGPALGAIHEALEHYVVQLFERSNLAALHGKRVTVNPKDMQIVFNICEE